MGSALQEALKQQSETPTLPPSHANRDSIGFQYTG